MSPPIYASPIPPRAPLFERSIFTHILASDPSDSTTVGGYPGSSPAFIDALTNTVLSRSNLRDLSLSFAQGLLHHPRLAHPSVKLARGSVVLIFSPNSLAWPVILFGSVAAGLQCTLANSAYTSQELAYQYVNSGAVLIMSSIGGLGVVQEMFQDIGFEKEDADRRILVLPDGLKWAGGPDVAEDTNTVRKLLKLEDLLEIGLLEEEEKFNGKQAHETVYLCYSSGTTGKPKGVESTHHNITSVIDIAKPALPIMNHEARVLGILPFYHIYGAAVLLHLTVACGAPLIIQTRFDIALLCADIQNYKITIAFVVPPILLGLTRHPAVEQYDLNTLQCLCSAAAPLGAPLAKQVRHRLLSVRKGQLSNPNFDVIQAYGLTETSPVTHILPMGSSPSKAGSIGILLPNLQARIVNPQFKDVKEGEQGELWISGPTIMKGYLKNPAATKDAITEDGWFRSGDITVRDEDGYYWIVDRQKELIKYKGFQVPPAELESVLLTHPDIVDAAVIGIHSAEEETELPRAYVVHAVPAQVSTPSSKVAFQKEVVKWMERKVAKHKFLRGGVVVIDIIPKSPAGKILRRELRDRAKVELATSGNHVDSHTLAKL